MALNIYQRINEVMKEVAYIQKDATVTGGGSYKAVTHDMVTAMVRPHFVKQGIVVVPRLTSGVTVDTGRKTKGESPIIRYEATFDVSFVNMDDPADVIVVPVPAHAEDHGDKAPGKAMSYATKYAILKLLELETGENDESRVAPEPPPLSTSAEAMLVKLRAAAMEGIAALHAQWEAAGKALRQELKDEITELKAVATKAGA